MEIVEDAQSPNIFSEDQVSQNFLEIIKTKAIAITEKPEDIALLASHGFVPTRANPSVYYFMDGNPHSYSPEQVKTLTNKC